MNLVKMEAKNLIKTLRYFTSAELKELRKAAREILAKREKASA